MDSLKLYCQQISEFGFLAHFAGRKKKKKRGKEGRKKGNKKGREEGRERREGKGRRKKGMEVGKEERKILLCPIRILSASHHSNSCQQSTHDLHIAKSRGHSQSSAYFIPQQNFILWSLPPQNTFFHTSYTALPWFSYCITGHFFLASLCSSWTSPWPLNGDLSMA